MPLLFTYPLKPAPPLAVYEQLEAFPSEPGPEALTVALPSGLLPLAARWNWSPSYAIVVFTGPFWGILTNEERDNVWDRWGVPVYEYRLDSEGSVIAQECDAHDGLHARRIRQADQKLLVANRRHPSRKVSGCVSPCLAGSIDAPERGVVG